MFPIPDLDSIKTTALELISQQHFIKKGEVISYQKIEEISNLTIEEIYHTIITAIVPDHAVKCYLRVVIRKGWIPSGLTTWVHMINVN